jgi:hypothetical protein
VVINIVIVIIIVIIITVWLFNMAMENHHF